MLTFSYSKSTAETLEKGVKSIQRKRCEIYSKLTITTPERHSDVFIVNFKQIDVLVFLLLTSNAFDSFI